MSDEARGEGADHLLEPADGPEEGDVQDAQAQPPPASSSGRTNPFSRSQAAVGGSDFASGQRGA